MPVSSTGQSTLKKILIALELVLGQDVDEEDKIEEEINPS